METKSPQPPDVPRRKDGRRIGFRRKNLANEEKRKRVALLLGAGEHPDTIAKLVKLDIRTIRKWRYELIPSDAELRALREAGRRRTEPKLLALMDDVVEKLQSRVSGYRVQGPDGTLVEVDTPPKELAAVLRETSNILYGRNAQPAVGASALDDETRRRLDTDPAFRAQMLREMRAGTVEVHVNVGQSGESTTVTLSSPAQAPALPPPEEPDPRDEEED